MKFLRTLLILGRASNLPTVWTNVIVGWVVGGGIFGWEIGWIVGGISLLYWAGMTLNDAFDAKWDRQHAPERPIPSGAISESATWMIGGIQMLAGAGLLLWKTNARLDLVLMLIAAILAYDWIHKKWKGSVLIMGLCRALVYYLAWDAARIDKQLGSPSPLIYILSIGVLLYIAGLTLAARAERGPEKRSSQALPLILLIIPITFPFLSFVFDYTVDFQMNPMLLGTAISFIWIFNFWITLEQGNIPKGIGAAIAGIALYDAIAAYLFDWRAGLTCLICFGLTLIAQRYIPAT